MILACAWKRGALYHALHGLSARVSVTTILHTLCNCCEKLVCTQSGYKTLLEQSFMPVLRASEPTLPAGRLVVLYDKNKMVRCVPALHAGNALTRRYVQGHCGLALTTPKASTQQHTLCLHAPCPLCLRCFCEGGCCETCSGMLEQYVFL